MDAHFRIVRRSLFGRLSRYSESLQEFFYGDPIADQHRGPLDDYQAWPRSKQSKFGKGDFMSSEVSIGVSVIELVELIGALRDLKRMEREAKEMRTSDGETHQVDLIFKDGLGRDVGVQKSGDGYKLIPDCHGLSKDQMKTQSDSIQQVVQRYSYRKVLKELQAQGYTLAEEEKRSDNTIRLVVRKWS